MAYCHVKDEVSRALKMDVLSLEFKNILFQKRAIVIELLETSCDSFMLNL